MKHLVLGDNQFFGINHLSSDRAKARAAHFRSNEEILRVLKHACDRGVTRLMVSTHDRLATLLDDIRRCPEMTSRLTFWPVLPYAHKYANAVAEKGPVGALAGLLGGGDVMRIVARGAQAGVSRQLLPLMRSLVDAELRPFRGLQIEAVFLQNIVTDLLGGLRQASWLRAFLSDTAARYGTRTGLITMNLGYMDSLDGGVLAPQDLVCVAANSRGYLMHPTQSAAEDAIRSSRAEVVAMSIFAAGAIPAAEAIDYVCGLPRVQWAVFGASTTDHLDETIAIAAKHGFTV